MRPLHWLILFTSLLTTTARSQEQPLSGIELQVVASKAVAEGDRSLRAGDVELAVEKFDRYLELRPDQMPYLWQRGIALYFAGKYDEAVNQFDKHRTVNPNDVENAAWHFLCVAKAKSPETAKAMLLPAPGDRREPMDEVLKMLSSGDTGVVKDQIDAVAKQSPGSPASEEAAFYGEFYLGLYADALGDRAAASKHMNVSAKDAPAHYMGDIARVYAAILAKQPK